MSPDGNYVAFLSFGEELVDDDNNAAWDVFIYDRIESSVKLVSRNTDGQQQLDPGNIYSFVNFYTLGLSADGQTFVWSSGADNLAPADDGVVEGHANNLFDTYLRRIQCPPCPADVHPPAGDGVVAIPDLLALFGAWGTDAGDVTGDGTTDVVDLLVLLAAWGPCT